MTYRVDADGEKTIYRDSREMLTAVHRLAMCAKSVTVWMLERSGNWQRVFRVTP